ncbi:lytic transglycosylase domain-containing protein [Rhizobium sp. LC145]|uniref:lytic transglycosylase domain-containing protein n=1 Tax=Rhizobium sp. LC145 TaxID=1120688 RepID=UPI000AA3DEBA|nr:lytic transglycosylase domain-containing protein [Rhizobium sp. LC145]
MTGFHGFKLYRGLMIIGIALGVAGACQTPTAASEKNEGEDACVYRSISADGSQPLCIRTKSYNRDLCQIIEHVASTNSLPPEFFARLIWRESLFRADAISPKGAEGIAQFMPATAKLRGLANSFDVIEALAASSRYLNDLRTRFGNLGLAAAAYNAGETGLESFLRTGRLPLETRDYVFAITGHTAETWKDNPPETPAPPLDKAKPFIESCVELASNRRLREPILFRSADWAPWGVQLAAHYNPGIASRLFANAIGRLPSPLNSERALIVRQKGGNFGARPRYAARIGRASRTEAVSLCERIKGAGGSCTVFKN